MGLTSELPTGRPGCFGTIGSGHATGTHHPPRTRFRPGQPDTHPKTADVTDWFHGATSGGPLRPSAPRATPAAATAARTTPPAATATSARRNIHRPAPLRRVR